MKPLKALLLLIAGTCGGIASGYPVPESIIQGGSLGFLIALAIVLAEREKTRKQEVGPGRWIYTRWLVAFGALWGAVVGKLAETGVLAFNYGAHSQTYGFHYPRTNTFGQTISGMVPGMITGTLVALAMGLAFTMLKEDEKMWFAIPYAIPLGWWTGAESLAIGQSLGHLNWEYIGPAQIQGMRFGIPWLECMLIFRYFYLRGTGDLKRMRDEAKAIDDAKWAAAESAST